MRKKSSQILFISLCLIFMGVPFGQAEKENEDLRNNTSAVVVEAAWEALANNDLEKVMELTQKCIDLYGKRARQMQSGLNDYVTGAKSAIHTKWALNDVATALFIRGKALQKAEKIEEAKSAYRQLVNEFAYGQCWDPKGWFWKPAEVAKDYLEMMESGTEYDFGDYSSSALVIKAWEALEEENFDHVRVYADKSIALYSQEAYRMQEELEDFPQGTDEELFRFWALNDVATAHFIKGKAYMLQGNNDAAVKEFQIIRDQLSYAQCWDPRGWWWKVSKEAARWLTVLKEKHQGKAPAQVL